MQRLTLAFAILIGISSHGQQIPNGDFETWVQESYGEEPANWGEYSLQLLNSIIPGLVDSTIVKSLDAYSGTYAMELRSKVLSSIITDTIIPLVMLNLKNENLDASKMKIDSNLESLSGYIKQDLINLNSNSTSISVIVYSASGDITGVGGMDFENDIVNYTRFDIPILYFDSISGDSIEVYVVAGNNDFPVPGNIMKLDALELNYVNTTDFSEKIISNLSVFPNPTNDIINVELENCNGEINLDLYDLSGKLLHSTNKKSIDIQEYTKGIYILKVAYGDRVQKVKIIKE